jgi:hypothetical protein
MLDHQDPALRNPAQECEACGDQIGTAPFLLATDGINGKVVAFHKRCDPRDADLQRHHKVTLAPVRLGLIPKGLA